MGHGDVGVHYDSQDFKREAAQIVDALLNNDELSIAKQVATAGPRQLGHGPDQSRGLPTRHVAREPYAPKKRAHCAKCGSYTHSTDQCDREGMAIV